MTLASGWGAIARSPSNPKPRGGAMGRITESVARRRVLVGVVATGALALGACAGPLKPAPEPDGAPALPNIQICAPGVANSPAPERLAEPAPGERPCVPFCLPGEEPTPPEQSPFLEPAPAPGERPCVPICPPDEGWRSSARAVSAGQYPLRADPGPMLARPGTTGRTRAGARGRASPGLRELLRPGPRGTASRGDRPVDEGEVRAALRVGRSDPGSSRSRALRTA